MNKEEVDKILKSAKDRGVQYIQLPNGMWAHISAINVFKEYLNKNEENEDANKRQRV